MKNARAIAFYLPQFHPIPENDEWWGEGFTEWTNVKKAVPLYEGHCQPNFPGELGFYDLRDPEVREQQANLAKEYGIEGFCYWHYWFGNGKRILEKVFEEVLSSGRPDFPFCLGWANETWTGIWHGAKDRVLIEQHYPGKNDYISHFGYLMRAFSDPRYITVDGKPLFVVYRPHEIDDLEEFVTTFRAQSELNGLKGLYLIGNNVPNKWNPIQHGFDAIAPTLLHNVVNTTKRKLFDKLNTISEKILSVSFDVHSNGPYIFDYESNIQRMLPAEDHDYKHFPCVISNWDNTPRSGKRGVVLQNANPAAFSKFLRAAIFMVSKYPPEERIVFLKSWNEWAEGNYLEPDLVNGRRYLEVCKYEILEHKTA